MPTLYRYLRRGDLRSPAVKEWCNGLLGLRDDDDDDDDVLREQLPQRLRMFEYSDSALILFLVRLYGYALM